MSELNTVKLQAENIDLRTQLERAAARLEKLHHVVMKTADVHVLADELEGTETDDEFFAVLKKKVRTAAKEAEKEGKFGMVPMEEFEALDEELQKALERETDLRTKLDAQASELRHAKQESRKLTEAAKELTQEVKDLKVERSVLQEAVEELTGGDNAGGTPPPPPAGKPPSPPPPPPPMAAPTAVPSGDLQAQLRKALDAAEKADAERKIALKVKERALKEAATAIADNARLQGVIDGSRRGEESAAQLALKSRKEELDEAREMLQLAERRNAALQRRIGEAENERLESAALAKELESELDRVLREGGGQPTKVVGAGQLLDLKELLLPPQPPPREDGDSSTSPRPPSSSGSPGGSNASLIPMHDREVLRARLLTRSRAVPLEPDVLDASISALQRTYRRLLAEARTQDPGNVAAQHACLLDCLLEREVQLQQLHKVLESMESAFGTRIASKEAEGAAYYARAVAAEGRLKDLKTVTHGLHLELADVVASSTGGSGGASPAAAAIFASPGGQSSGNAAASPGTETANRATKLLHSIAELNGLLSSFSGRPAGSGATSLAASTSTGGHPAGTADPTGTPSRQILRSGEDAGTSTASASAGPMSPGTAASNGGATPVSRSAARHSQRTLDLMERVRARQQAKQHDAASAAATAVSTAGRDGAAAAISGSAKRSADSASDASPVYDAARIDEALRRAAPIAEHIQRAIEAEADELSAAAGSPPQAASGTGTAAPSPEGGRPVGGGGAAGKAMEELLGALADRESEITRLEEKAASQATLIQLLKNTVAAGGDSGFGAASPTLPAADATVSGAASTPPRHIDPLGTTASSLSGGGVAAASASPIAAVEELATTKARLAVSEKRLEAAQRELEELRSQARGLQFLVDEERSAAKARVAAAEARADTGLSMAQQREAERDRAIETGKRLEAAVKRRQERSALGREQSVVIGGIDTSGAAAADDGDDLLPASPTKSIVVTPAMDSAIFAATLAKVKPRVSVDEETAATILSEAVESYEQLLNRVADHQERLKRHQEQKQQQQANTNTAGTSTDAGSGGGGAVPMGSVRSDDVGGDVSGMGGLSRPAIPADDDGDGAASAFGTGSFAQAGLDPEHLHEQALLELLFDLKLKMWHMQNDYRSMRAIVDIKIEDKEQEHKAAVEPLKAHVAALNDQVARLIPRMQNAEAEVDRRGNIIADLQSRLSAGGGGGSSSPGGSVPPNVIMPAAEGVPPHVMAEVERSLKEATMRIELLKDQLKAQGITPNC